MSTVRAVLVLAVGLAIGCGTLLSVDDDIEPPAALSDAAASADSPEEQKADGAVASEASADGGLPEAGRRAFVTGATYTGSLGGVAGANSKCNAAAQDGGLPGTFVAYLASGSLRAGDQLPDSGSWFRVDDQLLFIGNPRGQNPKNPLNVTPTRAVLGAGEKAWVGTLDGVVSTCSSWQNDLGSYAAEGMPGATDGAWSGGMTAECVALRHLYCFER